MTEFETYALERHTGEDLDFSRELPEVERTGDNPTLCVVSHPDAGGPCGRPARYEVWGLAFCEPHGLEANALALEELYHDAGDELDRLQNPTERPLNSEIRMIVRSAVNWTQKHWQRHYERGESLLREAYPVIEERVDPETTGWDPHAGDALVEAPVDRWSEERFLLARFLREAFEEGSETIPEALELLRERACAQLAAAYADSDHKLGTREERQAARD